MITGRPCVGVHISDTRGQAKAHAACASAAFKKLNFEAVGARRQLDAAVYELWPVRPAIIDDQCAVNVQLGTIIGIEAECVGAATSHIKRAGNVGAELGQSEWMPVKPRIDFTGR